MLSCPRSHFTLTHAGLGWTACGMEEKGHEEEEGEIKSVKDAAMKAELHVGGVGARQGCAAFDMRSCSTTTSASI